MTTFVTLKEHTYFIIVYLPITEEARFVKIMINSLEKMDINKKFPDINKL